MTPQQLNVKFIPVHPTSQNDFTIQINGEEVGTFWWKRNHPKPDDKVAVVRNLAGDPFICQNEDQAIRWLLANNQPDPVEDELAKQGIILL